MKLIYKILIVVTLLFIGINSFLDSSIIVERSTNIKRPVNQVFMKVVNVKEWQNWDPWCTQDSTINNTYPTVVYGLNSQRSWTSEESGSGNMTFTNVELNKKIDFDLQFIEPFESEASATFTFEQIEGKTKVSWSMSQEYPFLLRVFGLVADMMIAPDFELGLENLKVLCETSRDPYHILMFEKEAFSVYSKKENCTTAEIGITLEHVYGELIDKMAEDKITVFGKPICIYHSYTDTEVELEAALPVHQIINPSEYTKMIPAATVLKATYVGSYDKTQAAYNALDAFAAKNELSVSDSHYQIFITDPGTVSDPNKWVTEIYYTVTSL